MITTAIQKMAEAIGFDIGVTSTDESQAALLRGFLDGLWSIKTEFKRDTQMIYLVSKLDNTSLKRLVELAEYAKHRIVENENQR